MITEKKKSLSLYQPASYQIIVPGHLDEHWAAWDEHMNISIGNDEEGLPITTLSCTMDQAALQGLLRRLYSLGLPLISVICLEYR